MAHLPCCTLDCEPIQCIAERWRRHQQWDHFVSLRQYRSNGAILYNFARRLWRRSVATIIATFWNNNIGLEADVLKNRFCFWSSFWIARQMERIGWISMEAFISSAMVGDHRGGWSHLKVITKPWSFDGIHLKEWKISPFRNDLPSRYHPAQNSQKISTVMIV